MKAILRAQAHILRLRDLHRPVSPALQPWVEYLARLHPADREVMLEDLAKHVGITRRDLTQR